MMVARTAVLLAGHRAVARIKVAYPVAPVSIRSIAQLAPGDRVVIIGAGPAGLTAAYLLARRTKARIIVLEADDVAGGISRTVHYKGFRFDLGGHRFFTKIQAID